MKYINYNNYWMEKIQAAVANLKDKIKTKTLFTVFSQDEKVFVRSQGQTVKEYGNQAYQQKLDQT